MDHNAEGLVLKQVDCSQCSSYKFSLIHLRSHRRPPCVARLANSSSSRRRRRHIQIRQRRSINVLLLPLPILDMLQHNRRRALRCILSADTLHKIPFRVHHVEVDAVVDEIILLAGLEVRWCGEVNTVLFADVFDLLPMFRLGRAVRGGIRRGRNAGRRGCLVRDRR